MTFKFSGHETFPCRYTWLPKAYTALESDLNALSNDENAMISLGVGKNMVRAIRFWVQVAGVAEPGKGGTFNLTDFGRAIFSKNGFDRFLEDIRTLWLIHWRFSTNVNDPLFAWHYLLNRWQYPEFSRSKVLSVFRQESERLERRLSGVTLEQHFDTFLHTYVPTRGRKGEILEDNLDCPLVELELIQKVGEHKVDSSGKRESIYAFRREEKPEITRELFVYCIDDFWKKRRGNEMTLSFRDISVSEGSPGQIFKLPESDIRERLENIETDSGGTFTYRESFSLQQLARSQVPPGNLLPAIFNIETYDA
jgi:hypothetical protein